MSDIIPKISKVLNPLMHANKMRARYPLPVWDDTGTRIGVCIEQDKVMGGKECLAQSTFTLTPSEYNDPEKLKAKAELAVNAIKAEVLVSIRLKKAKAA